MRSNSAYLWFFIIGGFVTAAVGVVFFATGESARATEAQTYGAFLQIPLGAAISLYGIGLVGEERKN